MLASLDEGVEPSLDEGAWTEEEDRLVVELVEKHGAKKWSLIAQNLPGRIGKQCRERWHNHLNPDINKMHGVRTRIDRFWRHTKRSATSGLRLPSSCLVVLTMPSRTTGTAV